MAVAVAWPAKLKPSDFGYSYLDFDTSGGAGLGGGEQFVFSAGARWSASMTLPIVDHEGVLAVRALRSQLQGKANFALLPNFDSWRLSWPIEAGTDRVLTPRVAAQLAGTWGLEGTGYGTGGVGVISPAARIEATVQTATLLHATQVVIHLTQGGPILAGQQFGIGNRLYEIASVDDVTGLNTTVTFKPPGRTAFAAGTEVKFTDAVCTMRCLNLDEQTRKFQLMRFAELDLEFVEYL
jgi:hypothetical protein